MNERIKALRKALDLSQSAFGDRLGVKQNTVATWESGTRTPSDAIIKSICREFGVDEVWLRHGEGEMFKSRSWKEDVSAYMGQLLGDHRSELEQDIIEFMANTPPEFWDMLIEELRPLAKRIVEKKPPDTE